MKILNFGSANIDLVYALEKIVLTGETVESTRMDVFPGGKGLNQAVALAKAGGDCWFAGNIGQDGLFLRELLENAGVKTDLLRMAEAKTGHAVIQVDAQGHNCIIIAHGANFQNDTDYVDSVLSNFSAGDFLVLQNEINCLPELVDRAFAKGMQIVFNPSPINATIAKIDFAKLSYLILNETEAKAIGGNGEPETFFASMLKKYPNLKITLTLGGDGSLYADREQRASCPIYPVKAVDTTAAGDTFTGFFFGSLAQGKSVTESMKLATVAAGISVSRKGAAPSIPTLEEVKEAAEGFSV